MTATVTMSTATTTTRPANETAELVCTCEPTHSASSGAPVNRLMVRAAVDAASRTRFRSNGLGPLTSRTVAPPVAMNRPTSIAVELRDRDEERGEPMPTMRAVQVPEPGADFELVERQIPEPGRGEA